MRLLVLGHSCWPEQVGEGPAFLILSHPWHLGSVKTVFHLLELRKVS